MIHQPLGGVQGQATEIEIHAREILRMREELNGLLVETHRTACGRHPKGYGTGQLPDG